jgi:hypothetical protein
MNIGQTVFSQLIEHLPHKQFQKCAARYHGSYYVKNFSCWDQFLAMAFAQLTYRESLRDIEACLRSLQGKLYHMGFRGKISRSTLADANESRDWRIYADFAQVLISIARCLYDVNILDQLIPEAGSFYVMDRGYVDFERLYLFTLCSAFFVVRSKENILLQRRYSHPVDKSSGVRSDQTVILTTMESAKVYPDALRRVTYFDVENQRRLKFLTNNFFLPALTIAQIYKSRWRVELFFKFIKQHLRIKSFYGTSENAVKTQIWIAVSVYVLVAIVRKRLRLQASFYQILQILSLTLFEKMPILRALEAADSQNELPDNANQLILFDF